ncbi:hypothetical protein NPA31_013080 [Aurantimonas sp. MSK8Z-1]|uniref:hypothetical protein n=1 Tax=Mangrovibrevibacter kandeliae TaxID=2968473 RepID=UPI002118F09B|nr:hypothetical protein [Aurantimonas sp. MSK8Z-1]MCW4115895.1 hypothetical protein [Aurantimonas sp. MSK8Z-1]
MRGTVGSQSGNDSPQDLSVAVGEPPPQAPFADLGFYEVPVHADIPHFNVVILDRPDAVSSPMKARRSGEIGSAAWPPPSDATGADISRSA